VISIGNGVTIPESEIEFHTSHSSGPGGQNVNKVSTRVTLRFAVDSSHALSPVQRRLIRSRLATRINKEGVLQVTSQRTSSQEMNRNLALKRFVELLGEALKKKTPRIPTGVTHAVKVKRRVEKRKLTELKQSRGKKIQDDDE